MGEYQGAYKVCATPLLYDASLLALPARKLLSRLMPSWLAQITRGLLQKYGAERVRDTPITEVCPLSTCAALPQSAFRRWCLFSVGAMIAAALCRLALQASRRARRWPACGQYASL